VDVIQLYLDDIQVITRSIFVQEQGDFDVTPGQSFTLFARPMWSSTPTLSAPMTPDVVADTVSYAPQVGDFDEGIYRAWVSVNYGVGQPQTTEEFQINVFAHHPGEGTEIGAVWRAARALSPVAWDSLRGYPEYGDPELQRVIELAKLRVLPSTVSVSAEAGQDPRVIDYLAKKVLVDNVLSAAIDFWSNQVIQQTARGNSDEVVTYPDRIRTAENAIARFREDLERQLPEIEPIIGVSSSQYLAPAVDDTGCTLTPGLDEYPSMPVTIPGPWWRQGVRR